MRGRSDVVGWNVGQAAVRKLTDHREARRAARAYLLAAIMRGWRAHVSLLYQLLIHLLAPLVWLATWLRGVKDPSYRDRLAERFGFTAVRFATVQGGSLTPIWVHAVSVGEVQAAAPLVRKLLASQARPILMTTATPTGARQVASLFAASEGRVQHAYLPYDTLGSVRRFLKRVQPQSLIIMETELWPNLLNACVQRRIPVLIASARISQRTAGRYARLRRLFQRCMPHVWVGAQTEADAARYRLLGAHAAHVQVTGSIKFDIEIAESVRAAGAQLRAQLGHRPVWAAGSTHPGEDEQVVAAHLQVLQTQPDALLIIAPRHPQRFAQVAAMLRQQGLRVVTRSSGEAIHHDTQVLLLDTLGELTTAYAAADMAYVGGSLAPIGGHNLLEPAALKLAVLSGPHTFNAPDVAARLAEAAALRYVYSASELAQVLNELWANAVARQQQGAAAAAVLVASQGALRKLLDMLAAAQAAQ